MNASASGSPIEKAGARYLPLIDGLRALAVLSVILDHAPYVEGSKISFYFWKIWQLGHFAYMGVDVFFVLSGFLITRLLLAERSATGRIDFYNFFVKRALRILPIYYLCVFLTVTLFSGTGHGVPSLLLFVFNYYHLLQPAPYPLEHAWSLAVEEQFYLLWPFVIAALPSRFGSVFTGLVVPFMALLASAALALTFDHAFASMAINMSLPTRMLSLSLGGFLAFRELNRVPVTNTQCLAGIVAGFSIFTLADVARLEGYLEQQWYWCLTLAGYAAFDLSVLAYLALGQPARWVVQLMRSRVVVYVGRISYGLYLYHLLIFFLLGINPAAMGGRGASLPMLVFAIGLSLVVSVVSFEFFEKPIMGLRRKFLRPGKAQLAAGQ